LSIFEGIGLEGLGLEALGLEWWAIAAFLFILPKALTVLLALLLVFAERIPGFDTFAGGRAKAAKERLSQYLSANAQKVMQLVRPSKS